MKTTLKIWHILNADPDNATKKLNEMASQCEDIEIKNLSGGITALRQPVLVMFLEIKFTTQEQREAFDRKFVNPVALNVKP